MQFTHSDDFLALNAQFRYEAIVTNPPFSIKEKFLARCYELGKPFALLMPITTFDSRERRRLFHRKGIQLTLPNGRINFETPNGMEPIGYERSRRSEPIGETYLSLPPQELPKWRLKLRDRMDEAIGAIDVATARQRTLMAKLVGLRDRCHHPSGLSAEDRKTAEAVLTAAEAIIKAVEEATKPVL